MTQRSAVVIDDEDDIVAFLTSILEENDFVVRSANEASSGEDLIRESRPDVVLMDLMMPGRSGIQLFARLRADAALKDLPIIMVSGIKEQMNIDWAEISKQMKARKPDAFVEKPIDPEGLVQVIESVLSGEPETTA